LNEIVPLRIATWFNRATISSAEIAALRAKSASRCGNACKTGAFRSVQGTCPLGQRFPADLESAIKQSPLIEAINQTGRICSLEIAWALHYLEPRIPVHQSKTRRI
jgi:hypothetical protein